MTQALPSLMEQRDLVKAFVKSWVQFEIDLDVVESQVLSELASNPAAHQRAGFLYKESLSNAVQRREVALRLALAQFQESIAQL